MVNMGRCNIAFGRGQSQVALLRTKQWLSCSCINTTPHHLCCRRWWSFLQTIHTLHLLSSLLPRCGILTYMRTVMCVYLSFIHPPTTHKVVNIHQRDGTLHKMLGEIFDLPSVKLCSLSAQALSNSLQPCIGAWSPCLTALCDRVAL